MPFKKSEIKFIIMILIFIFGLTNTIPSEISIYDQYLIPTIEENTTPENIFYPHITFLIGIFRFLIVVGTIYDLYVAFKYATRYNVFGLRQVFYK